MPGPTFFIALAHRSRGTVDCPIAASPPTPRPLRPLALCPVAAPMLFKAVSMPCNIANARSTDATAASRWVAATTVSLNRGTRAWHPHLCTSASLGHAARAASTAYMARGTWLGKNNIHGKRLYDSWGWCRYAKGNV